MRKTTVLISTVVLLLLGCGKNCTEQDELFENIKTIKYLKQSRSIGGNPTFTTKYFYNSDNRISRTINISSNEDSIDFIYQIDSSVYVYNLDTTTIFQNGKIRNKYYKIDNYTVISEFYSGEKLYSSWEDIYDDCGRRKSSIFYKDGDETKSQFEYIYTCWNEYYLDEYIDNIHVSRISIKKDNNPIHYQSSNYTLPCDHEIKIGNIIKYKPLRVEENGEILEIQSSASYNANYEYDNDGYPIKQTVIKHGSINGERTYTYY